MKRRTSETQGASSGYFLNEAEYVVKIIALTDANVIAFNQIIKMNSQAVCLSRLNGE